MSYNLRILGLVGVLTISALGSALPLRSISHLLESTSGGSTKSIDETRVKRHRSLPLETALQTEVEPKSKPGSQFTIYLDANNDTVCRAATSAERREMDAANPETLGLRPINHLGVGKTQGIQTDNAAPNLTIVLRATQQLQQNADATAAFTRAAQNWEAIIKSPITIYIDVDYGSTRFGQPWPNGVLGSTSTPRSSYPFQSVRTNLIAEANGEGNAAKQAIFTSLPSNTVPTDIGDAGSTDVSDSNARAIGLLPAAAQTTDSAARIAFNSTFTFDFDPSDGITPGQVDFDAVATHEIGHALGFNSEAGLDIAKPSVWDLYRFRTGVTNSTFTAAQRILTVGGSPDPLQFYFVPGNTELGLSNGGPTGSTTNGADGFQSSHWKHVTGCSGYIGIMDPAIPSGCRRTITNNDTLALTSFGYNLTNNNPPPPPPPPPPAPTNDNFANAQTISGCTGSVTGTNFSATSESGEPSHDPPDPTSLSPSHTVWYQWQAPSSGSVTLTTAGSDFDTIIAIYTGGSINSLTRLAFNDDVDPGVVVTSTVTFSATASTIYRIAIDGWGGDQGTIKLNWNGCVVPTPTPTPTATPTATPTPTPTPVPTPLPGNDQIVISQIYATGNTGGSTYQNGYVELFNRGTNTVNLSSWTFQFGSETGVINSGVSFVSSRGIFIQPGQYLLVQVGLTMSGNALPTPDLQSGQVSTLFAGKVLLTRPGVPFLGGSSCPLPNSGISDLVGYGSNANCFEGTGPASVLTNTTALIRKGGGCTDTDNNANDFVVGPPNPRNTSSPFNTCGGNLIDVPSFFVKQHYLDFLNRQPDQSGWDFWTNQITSCGTDVQCIEVRRVSVSASFFLSIEFQQTGYLAERTYKAAFGDAQNAVSTLNGTHNIVAPYIRFSDFQTDIAQLGNGVIVLQPGWETVLENNKVAYFNAFVQRQAFTNNYPSGMSAAAFVDKLNMNAGNPLSPAERDQLVNSGKTRAQVLRAVAEDQDLFNAEFNRAFVLMQYFGYLRRDLNSGQDTDY
ncbi:MAG TPA: NF038122 family metalloprotease, partial [Pyrinomonadaceae bacterium]|nr:NF038122 family metalloprotease [Pyrinomonadaceae bacterium]